MTEELTIQQGSKKEKYETLLPQIKSLIDGENDTIANMANVCAALKQTFDFLWVGFYTVKEDNLVLSPFQGPIACTRIRFGKGVCGTAWKEAKTVIVPDVDLFPGHIACNSASRSEIVVPLLKKNEVIAILDIDSASLNTFDEVDAYYLEKLCKMLAESD
ncbi:GAF domain-containing protein [Parabacteroides sp. PF5-9]|uniref:GAF domain-containing protein n=1 Tax=Parabacteroides sp. PF5-9 TaxID=1742404 RepID=UPI0024758E2A|nr:GAF domain-containing protein [Parabacteroides sp. PF5-9]MDH6359256.1 L-methionine (R)-S-oxide reductase [Parabacteroides sp. PF5-9]